MSRVVEALESAGSALWICAHPDDENSSGGLVARAKDICGKLFMSSLTKGENSGQMTGALTWDGLELGTPIGKAREQLFRESGDLFDADDVDVGPFVNGPHRIEEMDSWGPDHAYSDWPKGSTSQDVIDKWGKEGDPISHIVGLYRRWRPEVVISMDHYAGCSGHPEHLAVARLLLDAIGKAADAEFAPDLGDPWKVNDVIFTAFILEKFRDRVLQKTEGEEPPEPIEQVPTLIESTTHGKSYFRVQCRVARNYENTMRERGRSAEDMETECKELEGRARKAFEAGATDFPILEPYRLRPIAG